MMYPNLEIDLKLNGKGVHGLTPLITRKIRDELINSGIDRKEAHNCILNFSKKTRINEIQIRKKYKDKLKTCNDKNKKIKNDISKEEKNNIKEEKNNIKEARKELMKLHKEIEKESQASVILETEKIMNIIL